MGRGVQVDWKHGVTTDDQMKWDGEEQSPPGAMEKKTGTLPSTLLRMTD